jgi:hypothetical protein
MIPDSDACFSAMDSWTQTVAIANKAHIDSCQEILDEASLYLFQCFFSFLTFLPPHSEPLAVKYRIKMETLKGKKKIEEVEEEPEKSEEEEDANFVDEVKNEHRVTLSSSSSAKKNKVAIDLDEVTATPLSAIKNPKNVASFAAASPIPLSSESTVTPSPGSGRGIFSHRGISHITVHGRVVGKESGSVQVCLFFFSIFLLLFLDKLFQWIADPGNGAEWKLDLPFIMNHKDPEKQIMFLNAVTAFEQSNDFQSIRTMQARDLQRAKSEEIVEIGNRTRMKPVVIDNDNDDYQPPPKKGTMTSVQSVAAAKAIKKKEEEEKAKAKAKKEEEERKKKEKEAENREKIAKKNAANRRKRELNRLNKKKKLEKAQKQIKLNDEKLLDTGKQSKNHDIVMEDEEMEDLMGENDDAMIEDFEDGEDGQGNEFLDEEKGEKEEKEKAGDMQWKKNQEEKYALNDEFGIVPVDDIIIPVNGLPALQELAMPGVGKDIADHLAAIATDIVAEAQTQKALKGDN